MTNTTNSMKVSIITEFGDSSIFKVQNIAIPCPAKGQLLIKSVGSSVNPIDTKIRAGLAFLPDKYPVILHSDFSGTVESLGERVSGFKVGDSVYGCCGFLGGGSGALAQYQIVDARLCAIAPTAIPLADCAVLPLVAIAAYEAIVCRLQLKSGDTLCVQSASGGVGHIAIQLAVALGLKVYGISTTDEKCRLIERYGATAFNRKSGDQLKWAESLGGFENIYNTFGGKSIDDAFCMARPYGTIIGIAGRSEHNLASMHAKNLTLVFELMITTIKDETRRQSVNTILTKIARLVDDGKIIPSIANTRFDLESVGKSHDYLEQGHHGGKKIAIDIV